MNKRDVIVGIDLGTTNSVIAMMDGSKFKIIPNQEGNLTTPSVIAFPVGGDPIVGETAKRQAATQPSRTVASIKRFMGRRLSEVSEEEQHVSYQLVRGKDDYVNVKIGDKTYAPPQISAILLRKLKESAEAFLGHPVKRAIITVPAYFNDAQRQDTRDAGRIAGFEVERILNEPTAAALAYGLEQKKNEKIAVFDLGGGTFDISILQITDGVFDVISTNGDTHLGGDDIDAALVKFLVDEFQRTDQVDLRQDKLAITRLTEAAEKAKKELSSAPSTQIMIPFITVDATGPKHLEIMITRAHFERIIHELVERCREPVMRALADAKLQPNQIQQVVLVGGSTRIPKIQEFVQKIFGNTLNRKVNPDEVVAAGAAVQGGVLSGEVAEVVLLDVTPLSLGVETVGGIMSFLIERNTHIPTTRRQNFTTGEDGQTTVAIRVYQGERELIEGNRLLGEFILEDLPADKKGSMQVEISFDIDADGILNVSGKHHDSRNVGKLRIEHAGGLSDDKVEKLRRAAEQAAEKDRIKRELIEARIQAEQDMNEIEKLYFHYRHRLPREVITQVEIALQDAYHLTSSYRLRDIESVREKLNEMKEVILKASKLE